MTETSIYFDIFLLAEMVNEARHERNAFLLIKRNSQNASLNYQDNTWR